MTSPIPVRHLAMRSVAYSKIVAWRPFPLIHDMVAAVDVKRLAGDEAGSAVREGGGGNAPVLDADEAARRRLRFCLVEQRIKFGNARGSARGERSRRDGVHADALRAELGGDIADRALERRLGDAHNVVVLNDHLAAV